MDTLNTRLHDRSLLSLGRDTPIE